jgi:hypothetical protein
MMGSCTRPKRSTGVDQSFRSSACQGEPLAATCHCQSSLAASPPTSRTMRVDHLDAEHAPGKRQPRGRLPLHPRGGVPVSSPTRD